MWGGELTIPSGLSNVIAISAGEYHNISLLPNRTVVAWGYSEYGQTNIPSGMNGVRVISARGNSSVVLRYDGTVVAWGNNTNGQISIPSELNGVIAISAGSRATATVRNVYNYSENDIANIPRNIGTLEFDNISFINNIWTFGTITTDTFIQGESDYTLGAMTLTN